MSRSEKQRLQDIEAATAAIHAHLGRGPITDPLVSDAVRVRLIEIGEAVKWLSPKLLLHEPLIPWAQIARMRDHLAHRYFETSAGLLGITLDRDLSELAAAVQRLHGTPRGRRSVN